MAAPWHMPLRAVEILISQQHRSVEWVSCDERLQVLCEQWRQQPAIAIDTEFIRTRTFYPIVGLLQVADQQGAYLIDPLAITKKQPLQQLMSDVSVVKVLHACSEDLEVFNHYLEALPQPLFDTQIAAAFVGFGASIGYASLIHQVEGVDLPKQETRSDWLQRPLSQSQCDYASLDVLYLLSVYQKMLDLLDEQNRSAWVAYECQQMLVNAMQDSSEGYYQRIKSAWKLDQPSLAVLKALCHWREVKVRELDIPRNRLIKDASLLDMAMRLPSTTKQLSRVADIHPRFVQKYAQRCLQLMEEVLVNQYHHLEPLPKPLNKAQIALMKCLKKCAQEVADRLAIPVELLVKKRDLEALVREKSISAGSELPQGLKNWREALIGQALLQVLNSQP